MTGSRKRLAFVVQRYGEKVVGGAEALCRQVAEHMTKYFQVDVLTTCAIDYLSWRNELEAGVSCLNEVTVRRFPVDYRRGIKFRVLNLLYQRGFGFGPRLQDAWMRAQGPYSTELLQFIYNHRMEYDLFVFITYLYCTTYYGLPLVWEKAVLVPTAHDEKPIYLDIFDNLFKLPRSLIFLSEEEKAFVGRRFKLNTQLYLTIGTGVECPENTLNEQEPFSWPYLIYVGRIGSGKGCDLLLDYFVKYKSNYGGKLSLVLIGSKHMRIPERQDIVCLGFVSDEIKWDYLKRATALVLPSRFESLSLAALEAMACGVPVLANSHSAVLKGHCDRSGGGVCYADFEGFSTALNELLASGSLRRVVGSSGQRYVQENYSWPVVGRKYLEVFKDLMKKQSGST